MWERICAVFTLRVLIVGVHGCGGGCEVLELETFEQRLRVGVYHDSRGGTAIENLECREDRCGLSCNGRSLF